MRVASSIERYRRKPEGHAPHLMSSLSGLALPEEIVRAWPSFALPADASALWSVCRRAHLFEDTEHRGSGLVLLDPRTSARRTAEQVQGGDEFLDDDLVIGEFLGDEDLVIIAPSEADERRILIVLEHEDREDWVGVGADLAEFLEAYFQAGGDKYWEDVEEHVDD